MQALSSRVIILFAGLALVIAATRIGHFATLLHLPDASWAVFFLGGYFLRQHWRLAFPLLMLEAVVIDFQSTIVGDYCLTVAYWFIVPSYALLWLGGRWFAARFQFGWRTAPQLLASMLVCMTACYLITNISFYWFSGRVPDPSLAGWWKNFTDWYGYFIGIPCASVGIVAALEVMLRAPMRRGTRPPVA